MNNPYDCNQVLEIVEQTLVEVLGCSPDEVLPDLSIAEELGGDSLDFVELRYVLEKKLGMTLPQKSVLDAFIEQIGDEARVIERGRVTELAAHVLQHSLFRYDAKSASPGMQPYDVFSATTVRQWANLCLHMFDYLPAACPECGHQHAVVAPSGKAACGHCGAVLKPAAGDEAMSRSVAAIAKSLAEVA